VVGVDNELIQYSSNDNGALIIVQRGFNFAGPPFTTGPGAPANHATGAAVTPWRNGVAQTGRLVQYVSIRRRAGRSRILDGKILYSNDVAPPSPSPDFERTTGGYWKVFGNFNNRFQEVVNVWTSTAYVEARWVVVVVANMDRWGGQPQRGKVNEAKALQYLPYTGPGTPYLSDSGTSVWYMVGHFLVGHAGLPPTKYVPPDIASQVIDTVSYAPSTVAQAVDALGKATGFVTLVDAYGYVLFQPHVASPQFTPPAVSQTWDLGQQRDLPQVTWASSKAVSQVSLTAREYAAQRVYRVRYPDIAGTLGLRHEEKDIAVASAQQALDYAKTIYRTLNVQRTFLLRVGYVPGLWLGDRHVVSIGELDGGGQTIGVNTYVTSFRIVISSGPQGSARWRTALTLQELIV
jgi:hypothetical protein